ncbi:hypothetical protein H0W80_00820 [Candidatus Saccharibacteria bacterium]|nr:hypothetical protein [Candidatus Saccharibacteria bacterium]
MMQSILVEHQTTTPNFPADELMTTVISGQFTKVRALGHLKGTVTSEYRITELCKTKLAVVWNPEDKIHFQITFSGKEADMVELFEWATAHKDEELAKFTNLNDRR